MSWQLFRSPIPPGLHVLHRCDNPPCINPYHLFLGTHLDNMRDMAAKGRSRPGEAHHNAKLTKEQVIAIRARVQAGEVQIDIARETGLSTAQISKIATGKSWTGPK